VDVAVDLDGRVDLGAMVTKEQSYRVAPCRFIICVCI